MSKILKISLGCTGLALSYMLAVFKMDQTIYKNLDLVFQNNTLYVKNKGSIPIVLRETNVHYVNGMRFKSTPKDTLVKYKKQIPYELPDNSKNQYPYYKTFECYLDIPPISRFALVDFTIWIDNKHIVNGLGRYVKDPPKDFIWLDEDEDAVC